MRRADLIAASVVIVGAMLVAAVVIGRATPDNLQVPVHWTATGTVDRVADKWTALFAVPVATAALAVLMTLLPMVETGDGLRRSEGLYRAIWAGMLVVLTAAELAILTAARGGGETWAGLQFLALGVLLMLVGNPLGKSRPMRFVGIRTPWTRANVDTWIATHRLGGRLMIGAGLVCWAFVAAGTPAALARWVVDAIVASVLIPAVYSYFDGSRRARQG